MTISVIAMLVGCYYIFIEQLQTIGLAFIGGAVLVFIIKYLGYRKFMKLVDASLAHFENESMAVRNFYQATYDQWSYGTLDTLNKDFKDVEKLGFDNFVLNYYAFNSPYIAISLFTRDFPPLDGEYLLLQGNDFRDYDLSAWFIITNKRYILRDATDDSFKEFYHKDIQSIVYHESMPYKLTITLANDTSITMSDILFAIDEEDYNKVLNIL